MRSLLCIAFMTGTLLHGAAQADNHVFRQPLKTDGSIPVWLVAGPFEQGIQGFGDWRSLDAIGESTVHPRAGATLPAPLVSGGVTTWRPQSADARNYLDLNATLGWAIPGKTVEQVWWTKAGYAYAGLESPVAQTVHLLAGTNSQMVVFLNGTQLHEFAGERDAVPDDDTVRLSLSAGINHLLVKIGNSQKNHRSPFFGGITFGWGGYFRILKPDGQPPRDVTLVIGDLPSDPHMRLLSTIFFRRDGAQLLQRHDLEIFSPLADTARGSISLTGAGRNEHHDVGPIRWGWNRIPLWLRASDTDAPVSCRLSFAGLHISRNDTLRAEQHYELHVIFLTHTDIGYTHPQPVVQELHCSALDEVLALCRKDPEFRWTIETVYQLEQYQQSRTPAVLEGLYKYMREGRIALSPVSTNPYTGWVSEEEMIRSMMPAEKLRRDLGITTPGAMYNDVPGLAWMMPRVLHDAGVKLLVCGLNEVYGGYTLQKSLPKAFLWKGADGTQLPVYRSETYGEGTDYGLERDNPVIALRMWERLQRLRSHGENRTMVLLNSAWFDNGPPAVHQFEAAKRWNTEYAYPRFVITTLADAATEFLRRYEKSLPVLHGDWTSSWDMLFQGEPERVVVERATQQQLVAAEAFDAVTTMLRPEIVPATSAADRAYASLLEYSGHGSGLEAGYGTPGENALTMNIREQYLRNAETISTTVSSRALTRIVRAEEAFEAEGVIVFNPLSWPCTVPVEVELKDSSDRQFQLTDIVTGRAVPSFRRGHSLWFVAPTLPSMGFKKFRTAPAPEGPPTSQPSDLLLTASSLENTAYRINFDRISGRISSIVDKRAQRELVQPTGIPFCEPVIQQGYADQTFELLPGSRGVVSVRDERPVRLVLSIYRQDEVVERTEYVLWSGVDRIDVTQTVHLESLHPPREVEVYAAGFPLAFDGKATPYLDILGGFLAGPDQRLPGSLKDVYSIRRSAAISDGRFSVSLATADSRIVFWRTDSMSGKPILLANLATNFPLEWNRNEANAGRIRLRFALSSNSGPIDPDRTSRLGWEFQTVFSNRYTLLRSVPAEQSYLSVTGPGAILTGLKRGSYSSSVVLRVTNVNPERPTTAQVTSSLFLPAQITPATLFEKPGVSYTSNDSTITVKLGPSETQTLLLQRTQ